VLKRIRPEQLIEAIHTVAAGDKLLAPEVTGAVVEQLSRQAEPDLRVILAYETGVVRPGGGQGSRAALIKETRWRPGGGATGIPCAPGTVRRAAPPLPWR